LVKSIVPSVKDKAQVELIREDGAHPEIRVNDKKLKANYSDFESLKKTFLDTLDKTTQ
jgi:hypothetical protein